MNPKISVIIPAYNAQDTIEKAVNSVVGKDMEIVIVVDGATDNTLTICQRLAEKRKEIRVIYQENQGVFIARKVGINQAKGTYIMFLDSDDAYEEETINSMLAIIEKYNFPDLIRFRYKKDDNSYTQPYYIEEKEKQIFKSEFSNEVYPIFLKTPMLNAIWNNCVKKEVLESIDLQNTTISYGEDLLTNLKIFTQINDVVFTDKILYLYNHGENTLTHTKSMNRLLKNLEDALTVYTMFYSYLEKWGIDTKENRIIVQERIKKECQIVIKKIKRIVENL